MAAAGPVRHLSGLGVHVATMAPVQVVILGFELVETTIWAKVLCI